MIKVAAIAPELSPLQLLHSVGGKYCCYLHSRCVDHCWFNWLRLRQFLLLWWQCNPSDDKFIHQFVGDLDPAVICNSLRKYSSLPLREYQYLNWNRYQIHPIWLLNAPLYCNDCQLDLCCPADVLANWRDLIVVTMKRCVIVAKLFGDENIIASWKSVVRACSIPSSP